MTTPNGIILSNPGVRTNKVGLEQAEALVKRWTEEVSSSSSPDAFVEVLDLHDRVYRPEAAVVIANFLKGRVSQLREANLKDIIASLPTEEGLAVLGTLSEVLKDAPLETIDLSDNALGIRGINVCRELLSVKTLQELSLENDGLDTYSMKVLREILSESGSQQRLRKLRIYNNMIGVQGAVETGEILSQCASLGEFRYEGCRPLREGSQAIAEGLERLSTINTGLGKILLEGEYGSSTEDGPLGPVCQALRRMTDLEHVKLYDCGLENDGTQSVLEAIETQKGLVALELGQNEIGPQLMKPINALVKRNASTLSILNLASNELTSVGVERLAKSLTAATALRDLNLQENQIGNRGARALIKVAPALVSLQSIVLSENGFDEEVVEKLQDTFGDKLVMKEPEDYDMDEDLEDEEEDDDDGEDDDNDDEEEEDAVDQLTQEFSQQKLTPDDVSI